MQNYLEILKDPYDRHATFKIKKHPPGRRLYWKGLPQIERKGYDGWTPVQKGDGIFEKLTEYINEPPLRYAHSVDSKVIRGQNILCWSPVGMSLARKLESAKRANLARAKADAESRNLPDGMSSFGPGLRRRDRKPDPTDVEVIRKAHGISDEDLAHPAADPRNYQFRYAEDGTPQTVFTEGGEEVVDMPKKRGRGRPKGVKNKPKVEDQKEE
ncbi:MAG: hypothetical protein ACXABY_33820 [Candidatus Thorarchaeota archaeon]|jgi:hypothetical protein